MVVEVEHSTLGSVKTIGLPIKFSQTPGKVRSGAPALRRTHQFNPRRLRI